jgi:hypothetical protein
MYKARFARRLTVAGVVLMITAATPRLDGGYAPAGEIVTRWVDRALQAVRSGNVGTPAAGRLYAMVTVGATRAFRRSGFSTSSWRMWSAALRRALMAAVS